MGDKWMGLARPRHSKRTLFEALNQGDQIKNPANNLVGLEGALETLHTIHPDIAGISVVPETNPRRIGHGQIVVEVANGASADTVNAVLSAIDAALEQWLRINWHPIHAGVPVPQKPGPAIRLAW